MERLLYVYLAHIATAISTCITAVSAAILNATAVKWAAHYWRNEEGGRLRVTDMSQALGGTDAIQTHYRRGFLHRATRGVTLSPH